MVTVLRSHGRLAHVCASMVMVLTLVVSRFSGDCWSALGFLGLASIKSVRWSTLDDSECRVRL